jgi:cyclic pyranopterin phosphate synthase
MPEKGVKVLGHGEILSYEELERLAMIFIGLGVQKIRITGGEPFVRKGCLEFLERLKTNSPELDLRLTTNGVAVMPHLAGLKRLGLNGINLSLDTLDPDRFVDVTRRDRLETVLLVFHETLRLGIPLKVNSVVQSETSDEDIVRLAQLVRNDSISLRFIELMPFSGKVHSNVCQGELLVERLLRLFPGMCEISSNNIETARKFSVPGYKGTLGIIEGESRRFCASCNKVRITPAGLLKNCLYDRGVLDLRELMRSGADDQEIQAQIIESVRAKLADGHKVAEQQERFCEDSMATIGG